MLSIYVHEQCQLAASRVSESKQRTLHHQASACRPQSYLSASWLLLSFMKLLSKLFKLQVTAQTNTSLVCSQVQQERTMENKKQWSIHRKYKTQTCTFCRIAILVHRIVFPVTEDKHPLLSTDQHWNRTPMSGKLAHKALQAPCYKLVCFGLHTPYEGRLGPSFMMIKLYKDLTLRVAALAHHQLFKTKTGEILGCGEQSFWLHKVQTLKLSSGMSMSQNVKLNLSYVGQCICFTSLALHCCTMEPGLGEEL